MIIKKQPTKTTTKQNKMTTDSNNTINYDYEDFEDGTHGCSFDDCIETIEEDVVGGCDVVMYDEEKVGEPTVFKYKTSYEYNPKKREAFFEKVGDAIWKKEYIIVKGRDMCCEYCEERISKLTLYKDFAIGEEEIDICYSCGEVSEYCEECDVRMPEGEKCVECRFNKKQKKNLMKYFKKYVLKAIINKVENPYGNIVRKCVICETTGINYRDVKGERVCLDCGVITPLIDEVKRLNEMFGVKDLFVVGLVE